MNTKIHFVIIVLIRCILGVLKTEKNVRLLCKYKHPSTKSSYITNPYLNCSDSFGSNHRASPDVPRANYCGHKMYSTSSTSEAMHPKSCSICQNYRKYFKLIPQESLD